MIFAVLAIALPEAEDENNAPELFKPKAVFHSCKKDIFRKGVYFKFSFSKRSYRLAPKAVII
jgi:hypothetical protein